MGGKSLNSLIAPNAVKKKIFIFRLVVVVVVGGKGGRGPLRRVSRVHRLLCEEFYQFLYLDQPGQWRACWGCRWVGGWVVGWLETQQVTFSLCILDHIAHRNMEIYRGDACQPQGDEGRNAIETNA